MEKVSFDCSFNPVTFALGLEVRFDLARAVTRALRKVATYRDMGGTGKRGRPTAN